MEIIEYNGLKMLSGVDTYPGSGTVDQHKEEHDMFNISLNDIANKDNPVMIEVGSFWALWSMLFKQKFPNGKNILIELGKRQLKVGQTNFELNGFDYKSYHGGFFIDESGTFHRKEADLGYNENDVESVVGPELNFMEIYKNENLDVIDLLHMDIQSSELPLILNIKKLIEDGKILGLIIATHSNYIHSELLRILSIYSYNIIINEQFGAIGGDGYIYAKK